jgi:glutaredoxin-related protein
MTPNNVPALDPEKVKAAKQFIYQRVGEQNKLLIFVNNETKKSQIIEQILQDDTFSHVPIDVENVDRFKKEDAAALEHELMKLTKQPCFPHVWANGTYLGGNHQTQRALKNGDLEYYLGL